MKNSLLCPIAIITMTISISSFSQETSRSLFNATKIKECMKMCDEISQAPQVGGGTGIIMDSTAYAACMAGCLSVKTSSESYNNNDDLDELLSFEE